MQDYLNKNGTASLVKYVKNKMATLCFNSLKGEQKTYALHAFCNSDDFQIN